eukprot:scpid62489/ scgid32429/ 
MALTLFSVLLWLVLLAPLNAKPSPRRDTKAVCITSSPNMSTILGVGLGGVVVGVIGAAVFLRRFHRIRHNHREPQGESGDSVGSNLELVDNTPDSEDGNGEYNICELAGFGEYDSMHMPGKKVTPNETRVGG